MNYSYSKENLNAGDVIEVELSQQANVILLDNTNYQRFKSGRDYKYYGGLAIRTPAQITVPKDGLWYIVIYLGGYAGTLKYSLKVLEN